ncbi:hypothetical protein [Tychonema sp. LEGE 06208]|uniref:hypothetical protein n=1 Tax=Tychonema sp. LEGE 06208 TaxID=1828663 RepID=UPI001880890D|nr:hypothetical protein [Tychonema sp. LEGE 06208]MBE9162735.1 hypothetical protein [Tychonema sp. LEGE 06208]
MLSPRAFRPTSSVRCPSEEGSSATSNVRDVTDVSPMSVGRRKKEEGRNYLLLVTRLCLVTQIGEALPPSGKQLHKARQSKSDMGSFRWSLGTS